MRKAAPALAALLLVACGPSDAADEEIGTTEDAAVTADVADAPETPVGLFGVDSLPGGEPYLTDPNGRALYTLEGEDDAGACVDACAQAWPPYTRSDVADVAASVTTVFLEPELVGTAQRADGTTQVTYDGSPLYYYARDTGPGQTTGQDVTDQWGEWYLVQPSGERQEAE